TPATRCHEGHSPGELEIYLTLICVGDFVRPKQLDSMVELFESDGVSRSFDRLFRRDQKVSCGLLPKMPLLRMPCQALAVFLQPVRVAGLEFGQCGFVQ